MTGQLIACDNAVFNESNSYLSVWHMNDSVRDELGTLMSKDVGTTATVGMIGQARHFPGQKGVFCGDKISNYPSGASAHSSAAWFRTKKPNTTILGWGNEGGGRGSKVRMQFRSPPHIKIDSDFSDVKSESRLPLGEWVHVVHTYDGEHSKLYIDGRIDGSAKRRLAIKSPSRLWIGGWYHHYDFAGDIDEVRISQVARSAEWIRLQYENQKLHQTLVGPLVQPGRKFSVSHPRLVVAEGQSVKVSAKAGGAQKVYWIFKPPGSCHYPTEGYAEFARLIGPLVQRDVYGKTFARPITAANLRQAYFSSGKRDELVLEFDQNVVWSDALTSQFYFDGQAKQVASGSANGNRITLRLKRQSKALRVTYLDSASWNPDNLLYGQNGIAALTFCDVPILPRKAAP